MSLAGWLSGVFNAVKLLYSFSTSGPSSILKPISENMDDISRLPEQNYTTEYIYRLKRICLMSRDVIPNSVLQRWLDDAEHGGDASQKCQSSKRDDAIEGIQVGTKQNSTCGKRMQDSHRGSIQSKSSSDCARECTRACTDAASESGASHQFSERNVNHESEAVESAVAPPSSRSSEVLSEASTSHRGHVPDCRGMYNLAACQEFHALRRLLPELRNSKSKIAN